MGTKAAMACCGVRVCCADLCEVESDITPLRWRVASVIQRTLGVNPVDLPLETRFMVGPLGLGPAQPACCLCQLGLECS